MVSAEPLFATSGAEDTGPVLSVTDLTVSFPSEEGRVDAVRGLSYDVAAGEGALRTNSARSVFETTKSSTSRPSRPWCRTGPACRWAAW